MLPCALGYDKQVLIPKSELKKPLLSLHPERMSLLKQTLLQKLYYNKDIFSHDEKLNYLMRISASLRRPVNIGSQG
jgi:hypothetical protein